MIDPGRLGLLLMGTIAPSATLQALGNDPQLISRTDVGIVLVSIATVVGVIAWVDKRIDKRMKAHEEKEVALADMRHASLMAEIRHLRREMRLPEEREITDPIRLTR